MALDINKLSRGDQVIGVSGIALFIFSFFKWLGVKAGSGGFSAEGSKSGWGMTLTLLAVLIGIAMVVVVALKASGVELPKLGSVSWGQVLLAAGAVAFVFVVIKLIAGIGGVPDLPGLEKTRKIGIFLGLVASAGLAAGGFLKFKEEQSGGGAMPPRPPGA